MANNLFIKRTLAMVLSIILCFSLFQTTASAAKKYDSNDPSSTFIFSKDKSVPFSKEISLSSSTTKTIPLTSAATAPGRTQKAFPS